MKQSALNSISVNQHPGRLGKVSKAVLTGLALVCFASPALAEENKLLEIFKLENLKKIGQTITGSPSDEELAKAPKPIVQLQVLSKRVLAREKPSDDSLAVSEIFKGQLVDAFERQGDWFKIKVRDSLISGGFGWVKLEPGDFGEMTLGQVPALGTVSSAADATGVKPGAVGQARPAGVSTTVNLPPIDPSQVPPPEANLPRETVSIPDRWRLMQSLGFRFPLYDPYNQNPIKGDLPVLKSLGPDWFFNLGVISDTLFEYRKLPTPVAPVTSSSVNTFGRSSQKIFAENLIASVSLTKGNTTFKPPDYEFRFVPVFNYTDVRLQEDRLTKIDPGAGQTRKEGFFAVQELFADVHLRNVSARYDFDSYRVGIQPFISDFRGFLFQDSPFGIRVFGNRANNTIQYNIGLFRRMEKDTNSGLNDIGRRLRDDDVLVANVYKQDFPVLGFTSQLTYLYNRNNENRIKYDNNGFLVRPAPIGNETPHKYRVNYVGYNGDGHFGKLNVTTSTYLAFGTDDKDPVAGRSQDIRAAFHATEVSRDFDFLRVRGNFLITSGDKDPYDGKATGFDAIYENPQFAGADTSFFSRQAVPLIGGGGVGLSARNGILPSLRSSKDQGQSNFVNPGLLLLGVGADLDVAPQLRILGNVSKLQFMDTTVLGVLRNQKPPSRDLGVDFSVGFQYRPYFTQNVVINGSFATLFAGKGFKELFDEDRRSRQYSALLNILLTY
jgi:hypothetical protein